MSVEQVEECGRCHTKVNLCNDSFLTFGRSGCTYGADEVAMLSVNETRAGYAVNDGRINEVKISWLGEADEVVAVLVNGEEVASTHIAGVDGTECIEIKENVCDCDVITVVEVAGGEDSKGIYACDITALVVLELDCDHRFKREGDGVFEAYISDGTSVSIPTAWSTVAPDTVRLNTIPGYVSYDTVSGVATLKHGVYKIDYAMTIETQTSTALNFKGKLLVNGNDYPSSLSAAHILAGNGGDVSVAQGVTLVVPQGHTATVELEAITDVDSSYNGNADANIIIERIANSIDL